MCNSPSITKAIVVATLAALLIPASFARADQPLTCKEQRAELTAAAD